MLGKPVPDFSLSSTGGSLFRLTYRRGKKPAPRFSQFPSPSQVRGSERNRLAWRGMKVPHVQEVSNFAQAL